MIEVRASLIIECDTDEDADAVLRQLREIIATDPGVVSGHIMENLREVTQ